MLGFGGGLNYDTDADELSNPLAGTHLDPRRRAWLRMENVQSPQPSSLSPQGPQHDDEYLDDPRTAHQPEEIQYASNTEIQRPENNLPRYDDSESVSPDGASSTPARLTGRIRRDPQIASDEDNYEMELLRKVMEQDLQDTPSAERINQLEAQRNELTQPRKMNWKQKLLYAGMQAAPMIVGGLVDGDAGIEGAAGGVIDYNDRQLALQHRQEDQLNKEIEAERGRSERQYERRINLPLAYMNARMMRDYRRATLDLRGDRQNNDFIVKMRKMGLDANGDPIPDDQLTPMELEQRKNVHAQALLRDAQRELAEMRAKGLSPDSPQFQLAERRVAALERFAQNKEDIFERDTLGSYQGERLPGTFQDEHGNDQGWRAPGNPTANTRQMGETSEDILVHTSRVRDIINRMKKQGKDIGPLYSRWNDFLVGKWGAGDKDFAQLRTLLSMHMTAAMKAHVGARGSDQIQTHFKELLNYDRIDEPTLFSVLDEMDRWWVQYVKQGRPRPLPTGASRRLQRNYRGGLNVDTPEAVEEQPADEVWETGPDGRPRRAK